MNILSNYPYTKHGSSHSLKSQLSNTRNSYNKVAAGSGAIALSFALAGCNNDTVTVIPCSEGGDSAGYICVDSEISPSTEYLTGEAIEMSAEQVPVSGTLGADSFVATSGFLTSKTIIDGGDGQDTLALSLQSSIKNSPEISNIETFSLKSLGDYTLDLSNVSDLEYIVTEDSLGKVTINGLNNPETVFGFSGSGTNNMILTSNDLGGNTDILKLKLNAAENVSFHAPLGYEKLDIELEGPSSLHYLLANGLSSAEIYGEGDLTVGSGLKGLSSFSSIDLNGSIVASITDYEGFSENGLVGSSLGTDIDLGSSADNFYFVDKADANALNRVNLGPGDDKLNYIISTHSQNFINGDLGNDSIKLNGEKLTLNDTINGGEGSDKVIIEQSHDNLLNLSETEILILKNIASGKNTVNSADDELSVIMETGKNGMPSDFSILGLPSLSNISVSNAVSETAGLGNILINYKELEPIDTILINTIKDFGDFLTENIGDVTINFAEPVRMTESDFKFNGATEVEINADESFKTRDFVGDTSASVNSLEKLFITGLRDVSLGSTVNTDKLKTINLNAYNDLIASNLGAGNLSNITLTSEQGDLKISKIDVTNSDDIATVNLTAKGRIEDGSGSATIVSSDSGDINASISGGRDEGVTFAILVNLEVTSPEAGIINLTSNSSGGIKSVITNAGKVNAGDTSKVILSDIDEEKTNEVTIAGIADNVEVSGGAGNDIINFGNSNKIKFLDINLSSGTDKIDFSNIQASDGSLQDTGIALNLSDSGYNVATGNAVQSGLVLSGGNSSDVILKSSLAEFRPGSETGRSLSTEKVSGNIYGAEWAVGTARQDYFIASISGSKFDGGGGDDQLVGNVKNDELIGSGGDDQILGLAGNDILSGSDGNDVISGGPGIDTLTGGSGNDTYRFNTNDVETGETIAEVSNGGTDTISIVTSTDFSNLSPASLEEIEIIEFSGTSQTGTFTNWQLSGQTLSLTEANEGISNLVINMGAGGTATFTDIAAGNSFTNGTDTITINGAIGNETVTGPNVASTINGGVGNDSLTGGTGNDILEGGAGADSLTGGSGNDTYRFNTNDIDSGESITETSNGGTDTISIVTNTDFANLAAANFDEIEIIEFSGPNKTGTFTGLQLTGETLSLAESSTGTSNLVINVGAGETATFGNLTASSSFSSGTDTVTINGSTGNENITGPNVASTINGEAGNDNLTGGTANDTLNGGDGGDSLTGGSGDDTYRFNTNDVDAGETITEASSGGTDIISIITSTDFANMSAASFDEIETIEFSGAGQTATFTGLQLTGETLSLTETASGTSNVVVEIGSGETVNFANITASTFASGSDTFTINGVTGNEVITGPNIASTISGNTGNDNITGGSAADIINGNNGNDTITGGDGGDSLIGGAGDDTYIFNTNDVDSGETITEASSGGTDIISIVTSTDFSNMSAASFDEIEQLLFSGAGQTATFTSLQLTGETLALNETATGTSNLVINLGSGETASFTNLSAGTFDSGADTITINGSTGSETITGPNVVSTIDGKAGNDTLTGGSATDTLVGGSGADNLTGGSGNDIFQVDDGDSGITSSTSDIITDFSSGYDDLKIGSNGDSTADTGNYVEAVASVADFNAALAAANTALNTLNTGTGSSPTYNTNPDLFSFQYDASYGYLFKDTDSDGDADMVIRLTGIDHTEIAHSDIIA